MEIKHNFTSSAPPSSDSALAGSTEWNEAHTITGPRFLGGDILYSNNWTNGQVISNDAISGLHIVKTGTGIFNVTSNIGDLFGVMANPSHECYLSNTNRYYETVTIVFKDVSTNLNKDPSFFSVIVFGDGVAYP